MIILLQGQQIGRIYVDRRSQELTLADITLLPSYRNQGIGSMFIRELMAEARESQLPLRLHVEHYNQARRLYDRIGFQPLEDNGIHTLMEWQPQAANVSVSSL